MKDIFSINDNTVNKITYYHLLAFLAAFPLDRIYSQVVLISLTLHTLIHSKKESLRSPALKFVLVPSLIFLVSLIGIAYSDEKGDAFTQLTRQIPFVLFPVIFVFNSIELSKYYKRLLIFFSLVCTIIILFLFFRLLRFIALHELPFTSLFSPDFINHNFSAPIGMHATYFSMYIALCLISCISFLIHTNLVRERFFYAVVILILAAGLIELSSRAVFIALAICLLVFPFFELNRKKRIKFTVAIVFISGLALAGILKIDSLKTRYINDLQRELTEPVVNNNLQSEPRMARWKCAMELIKKSPITGHGGGTEKKLLKEKYFEKKLYISYINSLDAHNQYLSFLLKAGIIGLLVFLFILFVGFRLALQRKDIFFVTFMILITTVSLSENILDVNKGILFYSFFFPFFIMRATPRL